MTPSVAPLNASVMRTIDGSMWTFVWTVNSEGGSNQSQIIDSIGRGGAI